MLPKSESDMYLRAGSNDSWQGHRLRRGDGRTPSEQVRQLTLQSEQINWGIVFLLLQKTHDMYFKLPSGFQEGQPVPLLLWSSRLRRLWGWGCCFLSILWIEVTNMMIAAMHPIVTSQTSSSFFVSAHHDHHHYPPHHQRHLYRHHVRSFHGFCLPTGDCWDDTIFYQQ